MQCFSPATYTCMENNFWVNDELGTDLPTCHPGKTALARLDFVTLAALGFALGCPGSGYNSMQTMCKIFNIVGLISISQMGIQGLNYAAGSSVCKVIGTRDTLQSECL